MTDSSEQTAAQRPGQVPIKSGRRSFWDNSWIVWAIPIVALVVSLGAAWRNYNDQGPLIEVSFENAAGIRAGETQLRYRDISVGTVEAISFSDDLSEVVAAIRIEKELAAYINQDAKFWIVRPEVTARGVSGLDTVLSGVYIQGNWDNKPGPTVESFQGLSDAPLLELGREGITFTLRAESGLPGADTPILYKGVEVGVIGQSRINAEGTGVSAVAVVYKPYTDFVTTSTRFWDISGFSFSLGAAGARLNFTSLASLISGGITFEEIGSGGVPLTQGAIYELFPNEETARDDFLVAGDGQAVNLSMVFEQNLAGLSTGAAVELGGLRVGEITGINGIVDRERFGDSEVRLIATARINPGRIGLGEESGEAELLDYLDDRIAEGMRARLTNASIFTGGLKIELVELPGVASATLDRDADPLPRIPTAVANVTDVSATAQGVLQRVNDLPIEEVMQSVTGFLDNASSLIGSEELQRAPAELTGILSAVRDVAESDGVQGLPDQIGALLANLQGTGDTLARVISVLEQQDAAGKLTTAIDNVGTATETLPDLVADIRAVLANAQEVPLAELSQDVSDLLATAESLIAGEDIQAMPGELRGILSSVRDVTQSDGVQALPAQVSELLAGLQGTTARLDSMVATLQEQDAAGKLTAAIDNVGTATDTLPDLVADLRAVLANAQALPLQQLSQDVSDLLATAESLIAGEDIQAMPGELRGILSSVRDVTQSDGVQALPAQVSELLAGLQGTTARLDSMVATLQEQDAAGKLTAAIDNVGTATDTLPDLVADLRAVLANAQALPLQQLSQDVSDLLATAESVLAEADALIAGEDVQAVPVELRRILASVRDVTQSAEVQTLPTRVSALLSGLQDSSASLGRLLQDVETQGTVGKLTAAVDDVAAAADGLPALVAEARGIVSNANEIPLDRLSEQATQLLASANALVDQESTRALPGELNAALQSVQDVLTELQDGGLVTNANATLSSARDAADAIAEASASLPRLAADLRAVANQAGTTLSAYADDSVFTRETRGAIRQIQSAAEAIERLARTIERNPNSLILGR